MSACVRVHVRVPARARVYGGLLWPCKRNAKFGEYKQVEVMKCNFFSKDVGMIYVIRTALFCVQEANHVLHLNNYSRFVTLLTYSLYIALVVVQCSAVCTTVSVR